MSEQLSAAALAWLAAEAIRSINHRTLGAPNDALEYPSDAYAVVAGLKATAQGLPQALEQMLHFMNELERHGCLLHCSGEPSALADELYAFRQAITEATNASDRLADALNHAHSALSPLGCQGGEDE